MVGKSRKLIVHYMTIVSVLLIVFSIEVSHVPARAKGKELGGQSIAMPVYYATNRQRFTANSAPVYSRKRRYLAGLEYGECTVTLPSKVIDFVPVRDYLLGWRDKPESLKAPVVSQTKSQFSSERDFLEQIKARAKDSERLVLFVHGYKSTFDGALSIGAQLGGVLLFAA